MPQRGHGVQFYNSDDQLLRYLTRYVGTALVGGDVAIVVATPSHVSALERRLAARGLDLAVARREGRLLIADAQATLNEMMTDGRVDEVKARAILDALMGRVRAGLNADGELVRVFAFGEMVALLAAQPGPEEAIHLEEIWNALARVHRFTLCCGYPMAAFEQRHAAPFVRICALHSHVFHALPIAAADLT